MPVPVTVNLAVEIDASGTINVFGQEGEVLVNQVVPTITLPVRAFYDAAGLSNNGVPNSLFEFWEPSDAIGNRRATLSGKSVNGDNSSSQGRDYTKLLKKMVIDFQNVLEGSFDCSGASPFNDPKYTGNTYYTTPDNFGRLALSVYAHYLFGHVAATAAITNDQEFMNNMLSIANGSYKYSDTNSIDLQNISPGSTSDANLALRIVQGIFTKDDNAILSIVESIIGQDASRAMGQDNNQLAPGIRQALRFESGDSFYISIRLTRPEIVIYNNQTNAGAPDVNSFPDITNNDIRYTLRIQLEDKIGALFPEGLETNLLNVFTQSQTTSILNAISDVSVSNGGSLSVSSIYDLSSVNQQDLNTIRSSIINAIFYQTGINNFVTTKSDLNITNTDVPNSLLVVRPSSTPLNISTVSGSQGIYLAFEYDGQAISFTNGSQSISITQVSSGVYSYNGTTYYTGDTFSFDGKVFIFGSVLIIPGSGVPSIAYSSNTFTLYKDTTAFDETPVNNGGVATSYSISPSLPSGLSFNTTTGRIYGTPTVLLTNTQFTITANNLVGSDSVTISIESVVPPPSFSYPSLTYNFTKDVAITPITPTSTGGPIDSYSIASGSLPSGLSFNTTTGVISGTPTVEISNVQIIISGTNSSATLSTAVITINVKLPAPTLSYLSNGYVLTKDQTIDIISPITGGGAATYSIYSGSLPTGLSLNTLTGQIYGTPTTEITNSSVVIRATNSGGFASFTLNFTVNPVSPNISYPSSSYTFTRGDAISAINVTNSGGAATYDVSGSLPTGLTIDSSTGQINGTPTVEQTSTDVIIHASNVSGSSSVTISFIVNLPVPDISYSLSSYSLVRTVPMTSITPTNLGGESSMFSIENGVLPDGLSFDASSGMISGTPTTESSEVVLTIRATNSGGYDETTIGLVINAVSPDISYFNPSYSFPRSVAISNIEPILIAGDVPTIYSIQSGILPDGLSFDASSGIISGTPTTVTSSTGITVRGTNSGGYDDFTLTITILEAVPDISYSSSSYTYTKGVAINNVTPSLLGGDTPDSYEIMSGSLPDGLSLDASSGIISGTPSTEQVASNVTIRASTTGGYDDFTISFTVNLVAPNIYYATAPFVFTKGVAITPVSPTNTNSDPISSFSIVDGVLPDGLSLDASNGIISGTPTTEQVASNVTIRAINSGGYDDEVVSFTVNLIVPSITYPSSSYTFTRNSAISAINVTNSGDSATYDVSGSLPTGITINSSTGQITGIPTIEQSATSVTIRATNSGGTGTYTISFTVTLTAPSITYSYLGADKYLNSSIKLNINNVFSSYTPTNTGDQATYSISSGTLPLGMTFDSTTGTISGTPTNENNPNSIGSTYSIRVTASNSGGTSNVNLSFILFPLIPNISYPQITYTLVKDVAISQIIPTNTGGNISQYYFSIAPPSGLIISTSSGIISGTPNALQTVNSTITASNISGSSTFNITFNVVDPPPTIVYPQTFKTFTRNVAISPSYYIYANSVVYTGGNSDWSFSITNGVLPTGLSFSTTTGEINGTPTVAVSNRYIEVKITTPGGINTTYIYITVVDVPGRIAWGKWVNSGAVALNGKAISSTSNNVYIVGDTNQTSSTLYSTFGSRTGTDYTGFIANYDTNGNVVWGKWINGASNDYSTSVSATSDGVYVVGHTASFGSAELNTILGTKKDNIQGGYIIKYDISGNVVWGKWIDGSLQSTEFTYGVSAASDGVYVTGYSNSSEDDTLNTVLGSKTGTDNAGYVIKYDLSGNVLWGKWINGSGAEYGYAISSASDGVYVGGYSNSANDSILNSILGSKSTANELAFIIKYNTSGNVVWGKWINGDISQADLQRVNGISAASDGVYVTGASSGSSTVLNTILGTRLSGGWSGYIIKYDLSGNIAWGKWIDGTGAEYGNSVSAVSDGVYVTGYSDASGSSELNTILGSKTDITNGAFVIKYNTSGNVVWGRWINGTGSEIGYGISATTSGVYMIGTSTSNADSSLNTIMGSKTNSSVATFIIKFTS